MTALAEQPTALHSGTFAVYATPDGGMHLTVRLTGEAEDKHLNIPGHMARMAEQLMAGDVPHSPLTWMKLLRKG